MTIYFIFIYSIFVLTIITISKTKTESFIYKPLKKIESIGWSLLMGISIFFGIGLWAVLSFMIIPYLQKLFFAADAIIFLDIQFETLFEFLGIMTCALGLLIIMMLLPFMYFWKKTPCNQILIAQDHSIFNRFSYEDNEEKFDDENKNLKILNITNLFIKIARVVLIICFIFPCISFFCYAKFTDEYFIIAKYGTFNEQKYSYDSIVNATIEIGLSPNNKNQVLNYYINFDDGFSFELDWNSCDLVIDIHKLLKDKNITFVRQEVSELELADLTSQFNDKKKEMIYFVFEDS